MPHHPGEAIRQCGEEEDVEAYDQGDGVVWLDHRWLGSSSKPAIILLMQFKNHQAGHEIVTVKLSDSVYWSIQ